MKKLECGDSIMAHRSFEVNYLLPDGVQCNNLSFLDGHSQLEQEEVLITRCIAMLWTHVERAIKRIN